MSQVQENKCDPTSVARAGIYWTSSKEGNLCICIKCHDNKPFIIGIHFKKEAARKLVPAFRMPHS